MKKAISIIRFAILLILFGFAINFIFGEEPEENMLLLFLHFIANKGLGIALCIYIARLYKHWNKNDPWLKAYDKMCDDATEDPDHFQL